MHHQTFSPTGALSVQFLGVWKDDMSPQSLCPVLMCLCYCDEHGCYFPGSTSGMCLPDLAKDSLPLDVWRRVRSQAIYKVFQVLKSIYVLTCELVRLKDGEIQNVTK